MRKDGYRERVVLIAGEKKREKKNVTAQVTAHGHRSSLLPSLPNRGGAAPVSRGEVRLGGSCRMKGVSSV